jgi:hypothetical protein
VSRHGRRGRHPHPGQVARPRPASPAQDRTGSTQDAAVPRVDAYRPRADTPGAPEAARAVAAPAQVPEVASPVMAPQPGPRTDARPDPGLEAHAPAPRPGAEATFRADSQPDAGPAGIRPTCTAAQLRRFIKSRPWIPLHELRRRFGIYGGDDDVTPVRVNGTTLFIGLPPAEGRLMGELLAGGDVGYELSLDPGAPIVVGVYPMRPVARG